MPTWPPPPTMVRSAASSRAGFVVVGLAPAKFTHALQDCRSETPCGHPPSDSPAGRMIQRPKNVCQDVCELVSPTGPAPPSQFARYRQGRYQLPAVALGAQLRRQLIRDVPGEDDGGVRLVGEQAALLDHRDRCPGHAFADLERARNLADIVNNPLVEPDIVDEGRGARGRADPADACARLLELADHG